MKLKTIDLPRKYQYTEGDTNSLYERFKGWNKLSYSQYSSFKDPSYISGYFGKYFLGVKDDGNIFSDFGGLCGEYWEALKTEGLNEEDIEVLSTLPRPETARYETEIVIDLEPFGLEKTCMQGFIDQEDEPELKKLVIKDLKTGNHKDKPAYYGSQDYQQTTIYCFCRDLEGYEILDSGVILLERKGNGMEKYPLKLSGKMLEIPTPYSRERAETFLKLAAKTCINISEYYKLYKKLFT